MGLPPIIPISTPFSIRTVHVEISSKCTLKCPRCPRTEGSPDWLNQEISLADFKTIFPPDILDQIQYLLFCGHTGDPIYATEFLAVIEYIKQTSSTSIRIVTNGSYKRTDWWKRLGSLLTESDGVIFSIDGYDDPSNNLYRVNSNWDTIMQGITDLKTSSPCLIEWSTIYFSFNQDHIDTIVNLAREQGCDSITLVRSSKFDNQYLIDGLDRLKPRSDLVADGSNYQRERVIFGRSDDFGSWPAKQVHAWAKCLNHVREVNISVDGTVYPCPWFNNTYQTNQFLDRHHHKLNAKSRGLRAVLEDPVWQELINGFDLDVCRIKCKHAR